MNRIITIIIAAVMALTLRAQEENIQNPFEFGASYVGDIVSNTSGGIKTGTQYLGMATMIMGFNTDNANWWKGGEFFMLGNHTHGDEPTANLIGDFQTVSNIEAGNLTYLQELWYKQNLGKLTITAGIQDLNADFVATQGGGYFINSSLGIPSLFADNLPSPIFPNTCFGISVNWEITETIVLQTALFDGNGNDFDVDTYNVKQSFKNKVGYQTYSELHYNYSLSNSLNGTAKIGSFYHSNRDLVMEEDLNKTDTYGFYLLFDQQLYSEDDSEQGLSMFGQVAISPSDINFNSSYYGGGLTYIGLLPKRNNDVLGVAVAYAGLNDHYNSNETVIELNYTAQLGNNFFVQPDLQYVINPSGAEAKNDNALVALLRFGLEF